MRLKALFSIAIGLLTARMRQTVIAAVGVMFGITTFIALLGFMEGVNNMLDGLMMNRTPHIRLYNEIQASENQPVNQSESYEEGYNFVHSIKPKDEQISIKNSPKIVHFLENDPKVKGVNERISSQVFYNLGSTNIGGLVNGVDVEKEIELYSFNDYMIRGNSMDLQNVPNSIILGLGLAELMLVDIGDLVQLTSPEGIRFNFKVVGIFQTGIADIDKKQSYVSILSNQKLLGKSSDYVTDILIKLHDVEKAPYLSKYYATLFDVSAIDINTANAQFDTGSSIRSIVSYAVGITLLLIAGFGIYNILNMLIYEKMDSIAILKATGFSGRDVSRVFIIVAMLIGVFGGGFGLLFGNLACRLIDIVPYNTEALPTITTYPVDFSAKYYIIAGIFSLMTTYFAGFFPSRKASRIDPVNIIRGK
jgi:lipoprotein-releasing system permease protein